MVEYDQTEDGGCKVERVKKKRARTHVRRSRRSSSSHLQPSFIFSCRTHLVSYILRSYVLSFTHGSPPSTCTWTSSRPTAEYPSPRTIFPQCRRRAGQTCKHPSSRSGRCNHQPSGPDAKPNGTAWSTATTARPTATTTRPTATTDRSNATADVSGPAANAAPDGSKFRQRPHHSTC